MRSPANRAGTDAAGSSGKMKKAGKAMMRYRTLAGTMWCRAVAAMTVASFAVGTLPLHADDKQPSPPSDEQKQPAREGDVLAPRPAPTPDPHEPAGPGRGRPRGGGPPWAQRGALDAGPDSPRLREFIRENFPLLHEELEKRRELLGDRADRKLWRAIGEMRELMEISEISPERGRLLIAERRAEMVLRKLGARYRLADSDSKRDEIRLQMKEQSAVIFDARQQRHALEIQDLRTRLTELQQRHAEAAERRDQLIAELVEDRILALAPPRPIDPLDDREEE